MLGAGPSWRGRKRLLCCGLRDSHPGYGCLHRGRARAQTVSWHRTVAAWATSSALATSSLTRLRQRVWRPAYSEQRTRARQINGGPGDMSRGSRLPSSPS